MDIRNVLGITVFTITLLLMGLSEGTTSGQKADVVPLPEKHLIEIRDFKFYPEQVTVSVGDTIVWINKDVVPHTATATDESWDTEMIKADESSGYVIMDTTGFIPYACRYHPLMKGTLMVTGKNGQRKF